MDMLVKLRKRKNELLKLKKAFSLSCWYLSDILGCPYAFSLGKVCYENSDVCVKSYFEILRKNKKIEV